MTPLERAARAIADKVYFRRFVDCCKPSATPVERPIAWDALSNADRDACFDAARAVLTAIREPSGAIEREGLDYGAGYTNDYLNAFTAMLDAALKDCAP